MTVNVINTPQPHYIPGYTGHVPGYVFRMGDTYGSLSHKILLDPTTNHSEILVLSDQTVNDFEVSTPTKDVINLVEGRKEHRDVKYSHPMIPGYSGFVPMANSASGQRFTVLAEEGLAEFEKQQMKNRAAERRLHQEVEAQTAKFIPTVEERQLVKTEFSLPLIEVRPETCGVLRNVAVSEPKSGSVESPYFMDTLHPEKRFIPGYSGHIPYGHSKYGLGYTPYTNSALCDFTSNYRRRMSTEWAPVSVVRRDPPLMIQPMEIYHKHIGMLPQYGGHIPGQQFRAGKTFGNDSIDAKKWLRGDFSL